MDIVTPLLDDLATILGRKMALLSLNTLVLL
jgi:hypothetical protein